MDFFSRIGGRCRHFGSWRRALCIGATVSALLPAMAVAHENAALVWVWSAVAANDNSELVDFLERNNGRVVDLLLEVPGFSGSGPIEMYDECLPQSAKGMPITTLPLTAFEIPGGDAVECGNVALRIEGEDHVSRHENLYPTFQSQVIVGSFRVIRLEEWGDAASQTVVYVIEGTSP